MNDLINNYHNLSVDKQKLIRILLDEQGIDLNSRVILPRNGKSNIMPMSFAQKRLWFLEKMEPDTPLYIIPTGVKNTGRDKFRKFCICNQ